MTRIKVLGLCLVAAFALSAFAAVGAQAGQLGKCEKTSKVEKKYTGKYTDKYCKTLATEAEKAEGKKNKYEWVASTVAIPFTSEGGPSHLKGAAGEITCESGSDSGTYEVGGVNNKDTFKFFGCKLLPFGLVCKSYQVGTLAGEITTNELASKFIDHGEKGLSGKEPAAGEVWEQETNAGTTTDPVFGPGPFLADFECGGVPFSVTGSVSGVVPANFVNGKLKKGKAGKVVKGKRKAGKPTFTEVFSATGGEQDLVTTYFNPETKAVESGASTQEGTNEVIIAAPEKGLELTGAV